MMNVEEEDEEEEEEEEEVSVKLEDEECGGDKYREVMRGRDKERERERQRERERERRRVFPIQTDTSGDTERKRLIKNDNISPPPLSLSPSSSLISSPQSEHRKER